MTRDLENYSVFFEMSGQPSLGSEGPDFVHLESYLLTVSGEILYEVGSEPEEARKGEENATTERGVIEQVFLDLVGTVSGVKLLAKLARTEGQRSHGRSFSPQTARGQRRTSWRWLACSSGPA